MTVLMDGISFGESPRWHDGRVWFSDWGAHQVIALDPRGGHEVVVSVSSFPMCIDFLPDGRLLVVDSAQRRLLRREPDGSMLTHADLALISEKPWNDIVVDAYGNAYVNNIGSTFPVVSRHPAASCWSRRRELSAWSRAVSPSPMGWRSPPTAPR
jgi:sugar lactone lactonase YvrE